MKRPLNVQKQCHQFLKQIKYNSYQFRPIDRANIYRSFGPSKIKVFWDWPNQMRKISMSPADAAYGWLGVVTAQFVLPIWEQSELPKAGKINLQTLPFEILDVAKGILLGVTDADRSDEFKWLNDILLEYETNENAYFALGSAQAALNTLFYGVAGLVDDFASKAVRAYTIRAEDTIPGKWVGEPWFEKTGKERVNSIREVEFWEWWLTEAIAQAWEQVA